jgi:hypothetical protein
MKIQDSKSKIENTLLNIINRIIHDWKYIIQKIKPNNSENTCFQIQD